MIRRPPRSTLLPDTTLFRSHRVVGRHLLRLAQLQPGDLGDGVRGGGDGDHLGAALAAGAALGSPDRDRKSTRLNSSHANISYAVFCLKKKHIAQNQSVSKSL